MTCKVRPGVLVWKIIMIFAFVSFFCSAFAADVITMKSGQKYGGVIIEYRSGYFVLKAGGKKYSVAEKDIASIKWSSTQAELDASFAGEQIKAKSAGRSSWFYAEASGGYMALMAPEASSVITKNMILYGGSIGYHEKRHSMGLDIMYGSMSGSTTYRKPGDLTDSISSIRTSNFFFLFKLIQRHILDDKLFFVPILDFGLGLSINTDTIDNYPLGWEEHTDDPTWLASQGYLTGPYFSTGGTYLGFSGHVMGGLDFPIGDSFSIFIKAGINALTVNQYEYTDLGSIVVDFFPGNRTKVIGGIIIQAGAAAYF